MIQTLEVVGLVVSGHSTADILNDYPYLEAVDISEALTSGEALEI